MTLREIHLLIDLYTHEPYHIIQGVAILGVTNTRGMSGAMWWPAENVAQHGLITIVMSNSPQYMGYYGSGTAERMFGTNPMAFAWPRPGKVLYILCTKASILATFRYYVMFGCSYTLSVCIFIV